MHALDKLSIANFRLARDPILYMGQADEARAELRQHYNALSHQMDSVRSYPATLPNGMKLQGVNGFQAVYVSPESYNPNEDVYLPASGLSYMMDHDLQLRLCAIASTEVWEKGSKRKKKS